MSKNLTTNDDRNLSQSVKSSGQITVRFINEFKLPYDDGAEAYLEKSGYKPWITLKDSFPDISLKPVFKKVYAEKLKELVARAEKMNPKYRDPGFFSYFLIESAEGLKITEILKVVRSWKEVKKAYINLVPCCPDPIPNYDTNARAANQLHLNASPVGIGSKGIWNPEIAGCKGTGIKFIDIERGWNLNHEDLAGYAGALIGTNSVPADIPHGTSVLGVVCAKDNTVGCIGIAPAPGSVKVISYGDITIKEAIILAAGNLGFGDVMLIEAQYAHEDFQGIPGNTVYVPIEVTEMENLEIQAATSAGIIVIEPGGNGNGSTSAINFNTYVNPDGFGIFSSDPMESGAVIVSASASMESALVPGTHEKLIWAPYGNRIDCYAWGENIDTLESDAAGNVNDLYRSDFGMSSGAAAIIAGAVLSIQGMVKARTHSVLSPAEMVAVLKNSAYGTNLHSTGGAILLNKYMPDLPVIYSSYITGLAILSANASVNNNVTCNGGNDGSATANPTGGYGPYTYSWNTMPPQTTQTAANLKAGPYTVTVTDSHGCQVTDNVNITEPAVLGGTAVGTDVTCNGANNGSIAVTLPTGGSGSYQYSLDGVSWVDTNVFNSLGPNIYTAWIRDKNAPGCYKQLNAVTIVQPAPMSAVVTSVDSTGAGADDGSITILNPAGGSGSWEFSINGGTSWNGQNFSGLGPGTYCVLMRDASQVDCIVTLDPARVINEPLPAFAISPIIRHVVKFGDATGKIDLTVSGGVSPYTFAWSNAMTTQNISGLKAGSYSVDVTDSSGTVVSGTYIVKHLYVELEDQPNHGFTIRLLNYYSRPLFGSRKYLIKRKGHFHPPIIIHPHPCIIMEHVSASHIREIIEPDGTWTAADLTVPSNLEGRIVILAPVRNLPIFRTIQVPVKIYVSSSKFPPFLPRQILVAEFKMKITNTDVDFVL